MKVLSHSAGLESIPDADLRAVIAERFDALAEYGDAIVVKFIVIESADSIEAIDKALGFPVLERPFELIEQHPAWYEIVFVTGDDGSGVEVFVPIKGDVPEELLAMCSANAFREVDT